VIFRWARPQVQGKLKEQGDPDDWPRSRNCTPGKQPLRATPSVISIWLYDSGDEQKNPVLSAPTDAVGVEQELPRGKAVRRNPG
jgi:hypothetical protein